jgi:hypothetical protein
VPLEDVARQQDHQTVAEHNITAVVYDPDAVGIAVVRNAECEVVAPYPRHQRFHVFGQRWIGMMVRKRTIHVAVHRDRRQADRLHRSQGYRSARAVAGVDGKAQVGAGQANVAAHVPGVSIERIPKAMASTAAQRELTPLDQRT